MVLTYETLYTERCQEFLLALIGPAAIEQWWDSPNKAFGGLTPTQQWAIDFHVVYDYLVAVASRP